MKYRYTVLSFDFNNYEILKEVENPLDDVEYIYVTNDNITSNTWKIVNFNKFTNPIESLMYVKYHPYEFCNTDICIVCDGSTKCIGNGFESIYRCLTDNECDLVTKQHPIRNDIFQELYAWYKERRYPYNNFRFCFEYFKNQKPINRNVLEINVYGIKKNTNTENFLNDMYSKLLTVKNDESVLRMDQVMFSHLVNNVYKNINCYLYDLSVELQLKYFYKCHHGTDKPANNPYNYFLIPITNNICHFN